MLRDKIRNIEYYNDRVNFRLKIIEKKIKKVQPNSQFEVEVKMKGSFRLVSDSLYLLHQKYTRGDDLSEFKPLLLNMLTYRQWQKDYADALPDQEQVARIGWEEIREDYLEDHLKWLSFAYCLNMDKAYYLKVLSLIGNPGQDALFDQIAIALGDADREIAADTLFKKRFDKLYKVVAGSPEQRPTFAKDYLDAWYVLEGSPDYHLMATDAYIGYWCWEIALVVKVFNIDDSSFINHPYYPKDLVHWQEDQ